MAPQKGCSITFSNFLFVVLHGTFGGVLKSLYIPLSLSLLNNLKPCFNGVEGVLGFHMRTHAAAASLSSPSWALCGPWVVGLIAYIFGEFFFGLFVYKLS